MSEKAKKESPSASSTISTWFQRISTMKPSNLLITIVVLAIAIFLFSGGIYDIVNLPLPAVYYNNQFYFLYPSINGQFWFDTVASAILYVVGFAGLLAIYQSAKHAYNPRQAYLTMIVGVTLLFISYLFIEYFIHLKIIGA